MQSMLKLKLITVAGEWTKTETRLKRTAATTAVKPVATTATEKAEKVNKKKLSDSPEAKKS